VTKPEIAKWTYVPITSVRQNPKNPRLVKDERFKKLVESIKQSPWMLELRPIVVDEEGTILAGNQRWNAARVLGMDRIPAISVDKLTDDQKREFLIKDNVHAGDFAFSSFFDNGDEWDTHELSDWGLDLPFIPKEDPTSDRKKISDADVQKASDELGSQFGKNTGLKEVTCPHCGGEFHLDP
jgi:hypothetical protein